MSISPKLALVNVVIQAVLIAGTLSGAYLGKKRRFRRHCFTMRALVGVQVILVGVIMAPSLGSYLGSWRGFSLLTTEIVIHAVLGVVLLGLWIFINLALTGVVKTPRRLRRFMWAALSVWLLSLVLGIQLYLRIWRSVSSVWLYGTPLLVLAGASLAAFLIHRLAGAAPRARGRPAS